MIDETKMDPSNTVMITCKIDSIPTNKEGYKSTITKNFYAN